MAVIRQTSYNSDVNKLRKKLQNHWGTIQTVQLYRKCKENLGITAVEGKVKLETSYGIYSEDILGIFIKAVLSNSCAEKTGKFKTGDRILEINGVDLKEASTEQVLQLIGNSESPISFVIQSLLPPLMFNDVQSITPIQSVEINREITQTTETEHHEKHNKSQPLSESESEDDDDEEDVRDLEGRTMTAKGYMIDRASAGNVTRTKDEILNDSEEEDLFGYTMSKIKKKYLNVSHHIVTAQLERFSQEIGLSLAGHKDRNCMAVFVAGLNPQGSAYKSGDIKVGDEILEINGVVLQGRCHLNVSTIIKGLPGPILKIILLRKKTGIDDIAVKPITQFPIADIDAVSEESFKDKFPNVRTVALRKEPTHSLGIMIIEGKHAGVGKGIFISDIQEGGTAEKAGLEIGEMILAVNKDSLIGVTYEVAASLLKNVNGVVTLIVSNPEKKEDKLLSPSSAVDENKNKIASPKSPLPASRSPTPTKDPAADPLVCTICEGKEVTIEIVTENQLLGIFFVGKGDNSTSAVRLIVYRPSQSDYTSFEINLVKKPGRGLGLSVISRKYLKGIYVADIINGGSADLDGGLIKGDLITAVDEKDLANCTEEEASVILKTVSGNARLKINRCKFISK
ncbi:inactivation-no-after-potential D protein isoform X2 [Diabrotica virgifera virgifera]|uniref:Inactivation-no-after-potential D protein isoform X2 n=1 Tax=Diabrotica virgifera virgifera TaxID=50390 RepID=A0A6P7F2C1_DIAVI|nr:inactivation-no-after-potential D protein isoform X2 [Diabrotica virgifera virgifera]